MERKWEKGRRGNGRGMEEVERKWEGVNVILEGKDKKSKIKKGQKREGRSEEEDLRKGRRRKKDVMKEMV